tara:strand:+ start:104 stop:370 length:267 start_codon:yes stop_codon:yes gene_type:complete
MNLKTKIMEYNNKIRQGFRDKTETMVMGCTHDGIPFSSEYVLWLEDELNKLRIANVVVTKGPLCEDCKKVKKETITLCKKCYLKDCEH